MKVQKYRTHFSKSQKHECGFAFDEADSIFGKRTDIKDAHDRYANTDTNYLLQAIESYPGIVILSSNKNQILTVGLPEEFDMYWNFPNLMQRKDC